MQNDLGALIVTYARGYRAEELISKAILAGIKAIFIWMDGPKNQDVAYLQETTLRNIAVIQTAHKNVKFHIYRPRCNYGAAASVLTGCKFMFSIVSTGVVLEDDLDVDATFFRDISIGIDLARQDHSIWMIAGTRTLAIDKDRSWDILNYPVAWGWGTTSTKWNEMFEALSHTQSLAQIESPSKRGFWETGYIRAMAGNTDAWDTPLAAVMLAEKKKCLIPPVNLVTNLGFDEHATHTTKSVWPLGIPRMKLNEGALVCAESKKIQENNEFYEDKIFRIRLRHRFTPLYDRILMVARIQKSKKLAPLMLRIENAEKEINGE